MFTSKLDLDFLYQAVIGSFDHIVAKADFFYDSYEGLVIKLIKGIAASNESEKPVLREVIDQLKVQNHVTGKTIHVADKGLNCTENIAFSRQNGDGYLFSKSVKGLSEKEKVWVRLEQDFKEVKDSDNKVLYRYKSCIDTFPYTIETRREKSDYKSH